MRQRDGSDVDLRAHARELAPGGPVIEVGHQSRGEERQAGPPEVEARDPHAAEPERRDKLRANSDRLFEGFKALGLDMGCDVASPVIAVRCADEISTITMWNALIEAGVYVNIALPPGTPNKLCLLRCSVSAAHDFDDIDRIIALFGRVVTAKAAA